MLSGFFICAFLITLPHAVTAGDPAVKCEVNKLKEASKYGACRLKAESKGVKKAEAADYAKCNAKFDEKWDKVEGKADGTCPTNGDEADIQADIIEDSDAIAAKLSGVRFVGNPDGTITDNQTGLVWEKKDSVGGGPDYTNPHDVNNMYTWSDAAPWEVPSGTVFVVRALSQVLELRSRPTARVVQCHRSAIATATFRRQSSSTPSGSMLASP